MKLKILVQLWLLIFAATLIVNAQNSNPYKEIGKKGKTLTLTNGQFNEFFDEDDVQQIGTNLVNITTMKVVRILTEEEAAKRLDNTVGKRFLSVDPLAKVFPELTPYQFASNRPIEAVDLDGEESKDLYMEMEPLRKQRELERKFGIEYKETKGQKMVGHFVTGGLGASTALIGITVLAPLVSEAPLAFSRLFWWSFANPQTAAGVAITIVAAATGYEGPDIPGPGDDFGRMGKKVFDKLYNAGIRNNDAFGQAARNSYNAIINTIDYEIANIATMEKKAAKAFEIRNKAKDFARELSGPENKAAAEAMSSNKHGSASGPTFEELYNKNYEKAIKQGLNVEDAKNSAYQGIIDSSKRPSEEVNKKYGAN